MCRRKNSEKTSQLLSISLAWYAALFIVSNLRAVLLKDFLLSCYSWLQTINYAHAMKASRVNSIKCTFTKRSKSGMMVMK